MKLIRERYDENTGIRSWAVEGTLVQWWHDLPEDRKALIRILCSASQDDPTEAPDKVYYDGGRNHETT